MPEIEGESQIDYEKAVAANHRAVVVALILSGLTTIITLVALVFNVQSLPFNSFAFVDIAIILGLTFGVYKKSRTCAILLPMYYLVGQISMWLATGSFFTLPVVLVFSYYFFQGIRGTYAYHHFTRSLSKNDEQEEAVAGVKHSGLGITSFVLGVINFVMIVASVIFFVDTEHTELMQVFLGFLFLVTILLSPIALIFSITGFFQKNRHRFFPLLGSIVNGIFAVLFIVIITLS